MYCIQNLPYSAGLMAQSCWFIEFKSILQLVADGYSYDDIRRICLEQNLFGAPNEYRAKRICGYLINRARLVDDDLLQLFFSSDVSTRKLINLIAILRGDRLFFEFIREVYREKVYMGQPMIEAVDINSFFTRKGQQSEVVEKWNDSTKKHLRSNYLNCMTDAGLLRRENNEYHITIVLPDDRLVNCLKQTGDEALLKAITGER